MAALPVSVVCVLIGLPRMLATEELEASVTLPYQMTIIPAHSHTMSTTNITAHGEFDITPSVMTSEFTIKDDFTMISSLSSFGMGEEKLLTTPIPQKEEFAEPAFDWNNYYRLKDIYYYLEHLEKIHKNFLKLETIGYSAEKRPIKVVKISSSSKSNSTAAKNKSVWIEGGAHAREWISPAATLYIVHRILRSLKSNNSTFSDVNYFIVPVLNPDGYEYSHTTDRFWRKNRSPNNGSECFGTDLNRNWGFKWGGRESKTDPCSPNYRGAYAFSESETASVSSYMLQKDLKIKKHKGKYNVLHFHHISSSSEPSHQELWTSFPIWFPIDVVFLVSRAYLTLHSYGQIILFPWGYTHSRPSDFKDLYDLAYYMTRRVKAEGGVQYRYGTSAETFYTASGGSHDWVKAVAKVKYSYTMELRDTGKFGFTLPVNQILETSKDAFAAFTVLLHKIKTGKYIG